MIQLKNISLYRGSLPLIEDGNCQIYDGQKIAVIGANGCGKSSLFAMLTGMLPHDQGELSLPSNWRIAHMRQEIENTERSALDFVLDGDKEFRSLEKQLLETDPNDNVGLTKIHERMDASNYYGKSNQAEQLLSGLGFKVDQFNHPVSSFSGGWRVRLNLGQTLMTPSDLMLLDEPTNHLDIDACIWLERWLKAYQGTLLFISHDRDFIDNLADHILSFEHKTLFNYKGNYLQFEQQKAQRLAQQQSAFEKQQRRISEIQSFVDRFRAKATKAKQAQSRLKELERMEQIAPAHIDSQFAFSFRENDKTSSPLVSYQQVSLGYERPVLDQIELRIDPGDRIGLLGFNGAGKSTLVKSLSGQLNALQGEIQKGQNLKVGYFAQHQLESLDSNASPLLHLQRLVELEPEHVAEQKLRDFLGGFGFQGEQADSQIEKFSGGEKARLSLALIAWQKPNLLLLDEPTNHLDLEMRHALTMAMQQFDGAVILVSHDRHLLRNTVDKYWLVHSGQVSDFDGDLDDYQKGHWQHSRMTQSEDVELSGQTIDRKALKRVEAEIRQKLSPIKKEISKTEKALEEAQSELLVIEDKLSDQALYADDKKDELQDLLRNQREIKTQCEEMELKWMTLQEELEELEASLNN